MTTFEHVLAAMNGSADPSIPVEQRFATEFRQADSDEPGLVLGDDGVTYLVRPDGTRVAVGSGGAQPSVSDILVISANPPPFDTGNSWFWTSAADDWTVQAQRGTDLSVVDEGGVAALHSVAGGDFLMHAHFNAPVVTLDGGSTAPRYLVAFSDFSPNSGPFSQQGFDALVPMLAAGSIEQRVAQPWFSVPADDLVTDLLLAVGATNAAGSDSFHVFLTLMIWKLGPLPT